MDIKDKEHHRITMTAIIYKEDEGQNKYLITKRSLEKKAFPGKWTVPGGGLETDDYTSMEPNEDGLWYFAAEKGLRREIKEEVNVEVGRVKYLLDLTYIRPDGMPALILSFYAPYVSGEVKLDADSIEYAWASYEECKSYELIGGIIEEIEMANRILKGEDEDKVEYKKIC